MDDNEDIIRLAGMWYPFTDAIKARLTIGLNTYGHGIRVKDDTTQWGTETDSWLEMGLEEIDDLAIYVMAQCVRDAIGYSGLERYAGLVKSLRDVRRDIVQLMEQPAERRVNNG